MALKIRMSRAGARNRPFFKIVVADSKSPRDGSFIERLGSYNPMLDKGHKDRVVLNAERIQHWMKVGAKPSDRVARFLHEAGHGPKPVIRETPKKSAPRAKAQERMKAASETADKPAAAPTAPAEAPAADAPAQG
jgi:small subunit ribosomal protein S16